MSRETSDREDLLGEATAFPTRILLHVSGHDAPIFAGFRRDGGVSLYFGSDPVYHFNSRGELRRAFVEGCLLKAEAGRLASLTRNRTANEVRLLRDDLDAIRVQRFLSHMQDCLDVLRRSRLSGGWRVAGQVPAHEPIARRLAAWLRETNHGAIARSPRAC